MEGMTYLAVGYFGMLVAIALWTYTVVQRSRRLEDRLAALESVASPTDASGEANNDS
jgi:hypothetical protein